MAVAPAMSKFQSLWYCPRKDRSPSATVRNCGLWVKISGPRKSFQLLTTEKMPTAASAGPDSGIMTRVKMYRVLAPSTRAASSSS